MNVLAKIHLPNTDWKPRPHQKKLWRYLMRDGKRAVAVWHRRAGKDEICLHATAMAMFKRPGNYWHCLPEFTMGRKAVFEAINPHTGKRRIDEAFPHEMRAATRDHDMQIRFHNGSTWQVIGSDSVTSGGGIGSSVAGIVFSEFALANPSAWGFYRPILEENNGWAAFISTPRGRNHLLQLYQHAQRTAGWFAELLTAEDTKALSHQALAEALREYEALYGADAGRAMYEQEMFCSFTAAILGTFYAVEMRKVREEERIVECEPEHQPVSRSWDLGVGHSTSIWFFCVRGSQILVLDHYVGSGVGLEHYADVIKKKYDERGWTHGVDWVPHDAMVKEFGTGRTRVETMRVVGLNPQLSPAASLEDGINAVRRTLPLCVFHPRCDDGDLGGISGLEQYRREYDDEKKTFKKSAVENWTTDIADSFRYLALSWRKAPQLIVKEPPQTGWRIPPPAEPRRGGGIVL